MVVEKRNYLINQKTKHSKLFPKRKMDKERTYTFFKYQSKVRNH